MSPSTLVPPLHSMAAIFASGMRRVTTSRPMDVLVKYLPMYGSAARNGTRFSLLNSQVVTRTISSLVTS